MWFSMIAGKHRRNIGDRNCWNLRPLLRCILIRRFASLSCNSSGISVNSAMALLKQKNNWLVYRDKLDEEENHEGKWGTTYFTALTQTCGRTTKEIGT